MEDDMKTLMRIKAAGGQPGRMFGSVAILAVLITLMVITSIAQQRSQQTFKSPAEAVQAMVDAAKRNDTEELKRIFGPQSAEILSSGDSVADKRDRERALNKYDEIHRLVIEPDNTERLYLGAENWPFPIPLVQKNGVWFFDTAAGAKEVLFRRIGRNEYATIDALRALVEAQKEYASAPRDGASEKQYAQQILSDEGRQNGLFWKPAEGQPRSPIGPFVAAASAEGYTKSKEGPTPFHGYIYRLIQSQGRNAPGGAMSYMTGGKMTRGFAIVAYPAIYRNSGVMTFIVDKNGKVYQKNLGPRTAEIAKAMTQYNPDKTWKLAE